MNNEQHQPDNPRARIKPLTSRKADGTAYEREDNVLDCIARYQGVPESVRISEAPRMPSEALMYFIRNTDSKSGAFYDRLFQQLSGRAGRVIHKTFRGLDPSDAKELSMQVQSQVMQLIIDTKPSPAAELFEIRFDQAVETTALQALRVYMRSPMGALRGKLAIQLDEEGDEMERPLEVFLAGGPGPEDVLLVLREQERRHQLLRKACQAVSDRRHLKAAILHWGYDWPITSKNRNERSLTRHFGVSEAQMHRWLDGAMKAMRAALLDEPEMYETQPQRVAEVLMDILKVDDVVNEALIAAAAQARERAASSKGAKGGTR